MDSSASPSTAPPLPALTVLLASPRGFCAGVDRAVQIVEKALTHFSIPVFVRHEIVHNRFVVENLERQGAVFVDELDAVPDGRPVIFSAHGVPKAIPQEARRRNMPYLDATCPLVGKVHREAERHHQEGREVILIGHAGHPEVIGTMGQLPPGAVLLVQSTADVAALVVADPMRLAYVTQTTLAVDEAAEIIAALRHRFPAIISPVRGDICFATTNRQQAITAIAARAEAILVLGAPNSSNSKRLVEVARRAGCTHSLLVQRAADIVWETLEGVTVLGISAGASAPEILVEEVIAACRQRFAVTLEEVVTAQENTAFPLPHPLS